MLHILSIIPDSMQVRKAVRSDNNPSTIAAKSSKDVDSGNKSAIIKKIVNTIADTNIGLLISFSSAIEKSITAIGITTKYKIIVKTSIISYLSKD